MSISVQITSNDWADFWRCEIGVNVIPANSITKKPKVSWKKWQTEPIPQEVHDEWKRRGMFDEGLAIICGQTFHKSDKYWINGIDCDSKKGIDDFIKDKTLEEIAQDTIVEQHANKEKCHILFYTKEPLHNETITSQDELGKIEIKSKGKHLLYCAGGLHKDGSLIDIIGTKKPSVVDTNQLQSKINSIKEMYGIKILTLNNEPVYKVDRILHEGDDRGLKILSYLDSMKIKNPEFDEAMLFALARQYERINCNDSYSDKKINELVFQSIDFANQKLAERNKSETPKKNKEIDIYELSEKLMDEYDFVTLSKSNQILFYKNGKYREGGEEIIQKRTRKIANNIRLHHINEIKGIIKDETGYISPDDFDKDSHIINTKQGLFDLKKGEMLPHSPDYLSRVQIPVYYDPDATCPRFEKFLDSSLEEDEKKIRTVLEMMALCLIKDNSLIQKAFMHTGKGSNGKSVLFAIIFEILGLENISAKTIHDFEKNHFAVSALEGKLANICADVGNKGISGTETLKKTIAGDPLDCERKFMEGYPFLPFATLIFSANDIPSVDDESDGFARRFELIEWEKSFYGEDRDKTVKTIKKDPKELSGIFNKLIPIAKDLLKNQKLKYESTVEDAKIAWLRKSDSSKRFVDEIMATGTDYTCPVSVVWSEYNKFCKEHGMTPLNDRTFNKKMEILGFERKAKKDNGSVMKSWFGFCLKSELRGKNQSL